MNQTDKIFRKQSICDWLKGQKTTVKRLHVAKTQQEEHSQTSHTHTIFFPFFFLFALLYWGGKNDQFIMCCVESDRHCSTINGT